MGISRSDRPADAAAEEGRAAGDRDAAAGDRSGERAATPATAPELNGGPLPRVAFVTGAAGFVGRAVRRRLSELGVEVRGVDLVDAGSDAGGRTIVGDISERGHWTRLLAGCDVVVHTAAVVSNAVPLAEQWRVNVLGTRNVVAAAATAGVRRLVHLSSVRVYSDRDFPPDVDEEWPVRPDGSAYVVTKIAAEQVVLQAHASGRIEAVVLRPGDVYGPGSRPWTIAPVEAIVAGRALLPAMGKGIFSPIYVDDLVDAIVVAATHPRARGEVFNVTGERPVTCAEFFGHYYRMLGKRGPRVAPTWAALLLARVAQAAERLRGRPTELNRETVLYLARRGGYARAKAESVLGWKPRIGLEEGMRRTERWLADQGLLGPTRRPEG